MHHEPSDRWTLLLLVGALSLLPALGGAQNVLSLHIECGGGINPVPGAVASIPGASLTTAVDAVDFNTLYDGGGWDVLVMGIYDTWLTSDELDRLDTHAAGGGKVVFYYWATLADGTTASHPLFTTTCPISVPSDYQTPLDVHAWDTTHPIFNAPNPLGPFPISPTADLCIRDGQQAEPQGGSVAIGGYDPAPTANQAAIIVSPGDQVIFNSFVFDNYDLADMEDLMANEILYRSGRSPDCIITGPAGTSYGNIPVTADVSSVNSATMTLTFKYTVDGGITYQNCTAAGGSPLPNPAPGVGMGLHDFIWDSVANGVGLAAPVLDVDILVEVDDGFAPVPGSCVSAPFEVDNTSLCNHTCGDCDLGGTGPNIVDALAAAQMSAGISTPTQEQEACCNVNSDPGVNIVDALLIAQRGAGLPVMLHCP